MTPNASTCWTPQTPEELRQQFLDNLNGPRLPVVPVGGGTSLPSPIAGIALHTSGLQDVIDYPARDMTITVQAGIPIAKLQETLRQQGQRLPIDIPQASRATLGGAMATNACGPGRFGYGTFRDYVIGMTALDGQGRLFSAGGRVVKNVAGYDLCKLLIGSAGGLAVLTQVTLKVRPLVPSRRLLVADFQTLAELEPVLEMLNTSATRPVLFEVLNPLATALAPGSLGPTDRWRLILGYEGSERETAWQLEAVQSELRPSAAKSVQPQSAADSDTLWHQLTEFAVPRETLVVQGSTCPSEWPRLPPELATIGPLQLHAGNGVAVLHIPREAHMLSKLAQLRAFCESDEGAAVVLNPPTDWSLQDRWGRLPASWRLVQQIKATLDPAGVLNPGWYGENQLSSPGSSLGNNQ